MPELPEVETIRRQLDKVLIGQRVLSVEVREPKNYIGEDLSGAIVSATERVGKYLYIVMQDGRAWEIHLKMTGRLVWQRGEYETSPYTRVVLTFTRGKLYFWDVRKFGYIKQVGSERVHLGPEPRELTDKQFFAKLQKTGRAIKNVLLDQKVLAGVGNIYANDSLWEAQILPQRRAKSLTREESKRLLNRIVKVLGRGLATGGASDNSYVDARGEKGTYQNEFRVYRGGKCKRCRRVLMYGKVGGRGTWWCETCQV